MYSLKNFVELFQRISTLKSGKGSVRLWKRYKIKKTTVRYYCLKFYALHPEIIL